MSDEKRRIETAIRAWATRPAARSPRVARARVLAQLDQERHRSGWRLAAATLVVAAVCGWFLLTPNRSADNRPAATAEQTSPGLLVYELRSGTKLYLALAAPLVAEPVADGAR